MPKPWNSHTVDRLFVLVLFCVFALAVLLVLVLGAQSYGGSVRRAQEGYNGRTALSFFATKVRQYDGAGSVELCRFGGGEALCLRETVEGTSYLTYLYCYDGALRELYCEEGLDLAPEDGTELLPLEELRLEETDRGLLRATCTDEVGSYSLYLYLRAGGGAS